MVLKGFLNINKPKDISSFDVVYRVRRRLRQLEIFNIKVGHTGTLDPFAEGILLVSIGKATKLTAILQNKTKSYIANIRLGIETDTNDITGKIIQQKDVSKLAKSKVLEVLQKYQGKIIQEPPIFSAIKIAGKKLYEYARNNEELLKIPKREIFVNNLELLEYVKNQSLKVSVDCSAGTYIRSLARDIGKDLGFCATLDGLIRTKLANFEIADSISLEEVLKFEINDFEDNLINVESVFDDCEILYVDDGEIKNVKNANLEFLNNMHFEEGKKFILKYEDDVLALIEKKNEKMRFLVNLM